MSMPVTCRFENVDPDVARAVVPLLKAYADKVQRLAMRRDSRLVKITVTFDRWHPTQGETYERANKVREYLSAHGFNARTSSEQSNGMLGIVRA